MRSSLSVADLIPRIPLWARTILDVGCGHGALGRTWRPLNPAAKLLGIDHDPYETQRAERYMDQVATVDVEADPLPFDVPDGIDCIVYRSILDSLADPWALVRRHARTLNPDGVMLLCLPNPEHWQLLERMLRGNWDADLAGKTPMTWLSAPGTRQQIARAGLVTCDVVAPDGGGSAAEHFADTIAPALDAMGIDPAAYARRAAASHLIWRARKEPRRKIFVAGTMLDPVGGVSHVRVVHPLRAIATDPSVQADVTNTVDTLPAADRVPRIFILHRPALTGLYGQDVVRKLTNAGYLIVTEFDDHPDHFEMMRHGGEMSFKGVHALQTSTSALADVLRQYNPEIAVFPNTVVALPEIRNFTDPHSVTLFYGALNRERDWRPLVPIINSIARKAGAHLKFQVVHDRGFFEALDTPHKEFTPTCDYETYLDILGRCEISFMPLGDTPFNRCKSDLKFIEAGSCRVAPLCSSVVYGDSVRDGINGALFRFPEQFHQQLLRLVALPALARALGDAARDYVAHNRMQAQQVAARIAWYRSLWDRRETLNEALRLRVTEPPRQEAA